jgi:hypothetical protein
VANLGKTDSRSIEPKPVSFGLVCGRIGGFSRVIIVSDRHRIAGRESLVQRFVQLAVDIRLRFLLARHGNNIGRGGAKNKKARYTEVPTPPCSKLAPVQFPITARMIVLRRSTLKRPGSFRFSTKAA